MGFEVFLLLLFNLVNKLVSSILLPASNNIVFKILGIDVNYVNKFFGDNFSSFEIIDNKEVKGSYFKINPLSDNKPINFIIKIPGNLVYGQYICEQIEQDHNAYYIIEHYNAGYKLFSENSTYLTKERLVIYYYLMVKEIIKRENVEKDSKIYVDGHSFGGAMSSYVAAILFYEGYINVKLVNDRSFGSLAAFLPGVLNRQLSSFFLQLIEVSSEQYLKFAELNLRPIDAWNILPSENKALVYNENDEIVKDYFQIANHIVRQDDREIINTVLENSHITGNVFSFHIVPRKFLKFTVNNESAEDAVKIGDDASLKFPPTNKKYKTSISAKFVLYIIYSLILYINFDYLYILKDLIVKTTLTTNFTLISFALTLIFFYLNYNYYKKGLGIFRASYNSVINILLQLFCLFFCNKIFSMISYFIIDYNFEARILFWLVIYFCLRQIFFNHIGRLIKFEFKYKKIYRDKFERAYINYFKINSKTIEKKHNF